MPKPMPLPMHMRPLGANTPEVQGRNGLLHAWREKTRLGDDQATAAILIIDSHVQARAEQVLVVRGQHVRQHQSAETRIFAILWRCQRS